MGENETLAKQLIKSGDKYQGLGRIVGMHDIKAPAEEDKQRNGERRGCGIAVLPEVAQETVHRRRRRETINANVVHRFAPALPSGGRTDDRNTITRSRQRGGLPANAMILRARLVFDQHSYPLVSRCLHEDSRYSVA